MKAMTAAAKAMPDDVLRATRLRLLESVPKDSAMLDACQREHRRRKRKKQQVAKEST